MTDAERIIFVRKVHFCFGCGLPFYRVPMHMYTQVMSGARKYLCESCAELAPDYWPVTFGQIFPNDDDEWIDFVERWTSPRLEMSRPIYFNNLIDGQLLLLSDAINMIFEDDIWRPMVSRDYSYQFAVLHDRHFRPALTEEPTTLEGTTFTTTTDPQQGMVWFDMATNELRVITPNEPVVGETVRVAPETVGIVDDRMYITHIDPGIVETYTPMINGRLPAFQVGDAVYLGENGTLTHMAPVEANTTTGLVVGYVMETTANVDLRDFPNVRTRIALRDPGTRPTIPV